MGKRRFGLFISVQTLTTGSVKANRAGPDVLLSPSNCLFRVPRFAPSSVPGGRTEV